MPLTPDQIERRRFAAATDGYDRAEVERFLVEVAAALRLALHSTVPPGAGRDAFTRVGDEVADVLRTAHDAAGELVDRAKGEADELRRAAADEAATSRERARRLLVAAQEQAEAIVHEAEAQSRALVATARDQAGEQARELLGQAQARVAHAERAEHETLRVLHDVHAEVARAIDLLHHAEVTDAPPGSLTGLDGVVLDSTTARKDPLVVHDPVRLMVRAAVGRAVEHAEPAEDPTA